MVSFDAMADEYAAGRPEHAMGVYDALEPLRDRVVVEGGCGTGISTRALLDRGARVIPFDIGPVVLGKAIERTPDLRAVVADGVAIPLRDGCADLVCFGQSWHWLDPTARALEVARVLGPGGRWAAWWTHARSDGDEWFDGYWDLIESQIRGVTRARRDGDEVDPLLEALFDLDDWQHFRWVRTVDLDAWLLDERSRSYIGAMAPDDRERLLARIRAHLLVAFPDGHMTVRYETKLWTGTKRR